MASNSGPFFSISSSMPSTIPVMLAWSCSIRRDENAGISRRRTRACCSPSIWVTNCASMILLNCSQPGPRGISEAKVSVSENTLWTSA